MNDILFNIGYGALPRARGRAVPDRRRRRAVRRNALIILMSVELMLNAANMTLLDVLAHVGRHERSRRTRSR